jgi:site-specific DNA-methyltransferase (adenine-specific)
MWGGAVNSVEDVLSENAQWCVIHGDNSEVLPSIPSASIRHMITDPPYSERVHSKSRAGAQKKPLLDGNGHLTRCAIDREVDFGFDPITQDEIEFISDEAARITTRWSLVFSDVESSHLWRGAMTSTGSLEYCRTGAWVKVGATPQFTGDRPAVAFEAITICHKPGKKRWNGGGSRGLWEHFVCSGHASKGNSVREHPTQKPLKLMLELVEQFTDPGDIIIDPYCGGGTTGVAAIRLGRRCIMIEKLNTEKQPFADIARTRCEAEVNLSDRKSLVSGQGSLFG